MHTQRDRRRFLQSLAAGGAAAAAGSFAAPSRATAQATTTQTASDGFFTVAKQNNRWWFFDPDDNPQFSLGLNHVDPASLRYVENGSVWRERYGNDMRRWLTESVRPNLTEWGFNCLGWNQEVVTRQPTNHRHSRSFTFEEYQWLDMPYCHMLPFSEIHQWQAESKLPDFRSPGFVDWCDHVAREHCSRFRDDPKLIGYWYSDCPVWVHTRAINAWRGPIFDPEKLKSPAGRQELSDLATAYYQTTHDAIRRYDPHHLILGDRYEANAALPDEVVRAAVPLVDVLSFQCFGSASNVQEKLSAWAKKFDRPIVLADHAISRKPSTGAKYHDAAGYAATLQAMTGIPQVVGYHLCGAYVRNRVRNRGLLDENERPDETAIRGIRASNEAVAAWVKTASKVP